MSATTPVMAFTVAFAEPVEIRGRVVDARGGAPIEGASVHASRADVFATTAKDGTFVLPGVPESSALVVAAKEGYAFASTTTEGSLTLKLNRDTTPARLAAPRCSLTSPRS